MNVECWNVGMLADNRGDAARLVTRHDEQPGMDTSAFASEFRLAPKQLLRNGGFAKSNGGFSAIGAKWHCSPREARAALLVRRAPYPPAKRRQCTPRATGCNAINASLLGAKAIANRTNSLGGSQRNTSEPNVVFYCRTNPAARWACIDVTVYEMHVLT